MKEKKPLHVERKCFYSVLSENWFQMFSEIRIKIIRTNYNHSRNVPAGYILSDADQVQIMNLNHFYSLSIIIVKFIHFFIRSIYDSNLCSWQQIHYKGAGPCTQRYTKQYFPSRPTNKKIINSLLQFHVFWAKRANHWWKTTNAFDCIFRTCA